MSVTMDLDCEYDGCDQYVAMVVRRTPGECMDLAVLRGWVILRDSAGNIAAVFCPNHRAQREGGNSIESSQNPARSDQEQNRK